MGAKVIGLGSMTGVVGGQGTYLAQRSPVPVTTGNSLTVFAAIENVHHAAAELEIDLRHETVAVVGVPGSIATACAKLLAPHCGHLILVGRRPSDRASALARELGASLEFDIPTAVARAKIVVSATSAGHCIEQAMLKPWSVVVDVAIPTDICESHATRDDVLVLSGGLTQIPDCMPRTSKFLWFHHGMIPSCLAETMVLALEERPESFSLGRSLDVDKINEIGGIAKSHGFDFSRFFSFGLPLDDSALIRFRKANSRLVRRPAAAKLLPAQTATAIRKRNRPRVGTVLTESRTARARASRIRSIRKLPQKSLTSLSPKSCLPGISIPSSWRWEAKGASSKHSCAARARTCGMPTAFRTSISSLASGPSTSGTTIRRLSPR